MSSPVLLPQDLLASVSDFFTSYFDASASFDTAFDAPAGDNLGDARIRAAGVNPATGKLISPNYAQAAANTGYDPSDPAAYLATVRAAVDAEYQKQFNAFNGSAPFGSSIDWTQVLSYAVIGIVVLIVVMKVL